MNNNNVQSIGAVVETATRDLGISQEQQTTDEYIRKMSIDLADMKKFIKEGFVDKLKDVFSPIGRMAENQKSMFQEYTKKIVVNTEKKKDNVNELGELIKFLTEKKASGGQLTTTEQKTLLQEKERQVRAYKGGSMLFNPMGVIGEKMDKAALGGMSKLTGRMGMTGISKMLDVSREKIDLRQKERADVIAGVKDPKPVVTEKEAVQEVIEDTGKGKGRAKSKDSSELVKMMTDRFARIETPINSILDEVTGIHDMMIKSEGADWASRQKKNEHEKKIETPLPAAEAKEKEAATATGGGGGIFSLIRNLKDFGSLIKTATLSMGGWLTAGKGIAGLLGSDLTGAGGIASMGAGAMVGTGALIAGTAVAGAAAGYGINKLGNKLMPGDVEGKITGKTDFNDLLTNIAINTNPLGIIAKNTGLLDGILASNKDIADAQKQGLKESTELNKNLTDMKKSGLGTVERQTAIARTSLMSDIGITDEKERSRLTDMSESDFQKEIDTKYGNKWFGKGTKAEKSLKEYQTKIAKAKKRSNGGKDVDVATGKTPNESMPVFSNEEMPPETSSKYVDGKLVSRRKLTDADHKRIDAEMDAAEAKAQARESNTVDNKPNVPFSSRFGMEDEDTFASSNSANIKVAPNLKTPPREYDNVEDTIKQNKSNAAENQKTIRHQIDMNNTLKQINDGIRQLNVKEPVEFSTYLNQSFYPDWGQAGFTNAFAGVLPN